MRTSGTVIECGLENRIMHLAARQHVGERMTDQFADAQLALGWRFIRRG